MILKDPNYKPGMKVILHSCNTGGDNSSPDGSSDGFTFAQQLANLLGAEVYAPDNVINDSTSYAHTGLPGYNVALPSTYSVGGGGSYHGFYPTEGP
jgi:hypothetical protein